MKTYMIDQASLDVTLTADPASVVSGMPTTSNGIEARLRFDTLHQAAAQGGDSAVYNMGNGMGFSVKEVIALAKQVTGLPVKSIVGPRRPGDPARLVAGSDRIKKDLGWNPRFPELRTIIETAWEWHRSHPNGYRRA